MHPIHVKMIRVLGYLLAIGLLTGSVAFAQLGSTNKVVATVTATANVIGNVDLIVMKDLEIEIGSLSPTELIVNPQEDPRCGEIKIIGSPNSLVRVTTEKQSMIRHENGQSRLYFTYNIAGDTLDIQPESVPLTQNNEVRLSGQGVYYMWLGGELSGLEDIMPGDYTMDLTIDVEYVL
jgi:hypothetical protein